MTRERRRGFIKREHCVWEGVVWVLLEESTSGGEFDPPSDGFGFPAGSGGPDERGHGRQRNSGVQTGRTGRGSTGEDQAARRAQSGEVRADQEQFASLFSVVQFNLFQPSLAHFSLTLLSLVWLWGHGPGLWQFWGHTPCGNRTGAKMFPGKHAFTFFSEIWKPSCCFEPLSSYRSECVPRSLENLETLTHSRVQSSLH